MSDHDPVDWDLMQAARTLLKNFELPRRERLLLARIVRIGLARSEPSAIPYDLERVAWELEAIAVGHANFPSALRVAMAIPDIDDEARLLLGRFACGHDTDGDHAHLQELATWVRMQRHRSPPRNPARAMEVDRP